MSVFRVEKNKNYTVMSNFHLRDKNLSLKTKGLLSVMLSLPEDWDYTEAGLAYITGEGKDSIKKCLRQMEEFGYLKRQRIRDDNGRLGGTEYTIYEVPETDNSPEAENPTLVKPTQVQPSLEQPALENQQQIKKDIINYKFNNKIINN
ncbi:MAG: helix-turn-helix domain-containing protein, partial [Parasporobacterium sp.]|nr:helix-turn-helix domain-containing protein [Parasporobacterium sp.]